MTGERPPEADLVSPMERIARDLEAIKLWLKLCLLVLVVIAGELLYRIVDAHS